MTLLPFIAFMVVLLVVGMALAGRHQRQMKAAAAELATTLGFQVLEGPDALRWMAPGTSGAGSPDAYESLPAPMRKLLDASRVGSCIAGTVEGIRVAIFYETRGGGKSRTKYTVVRAWYPTPLPYELRIGHEGGFTRIGKALFGLSDVEIGDAEFDRAVRIRAGDESAARVMLGRYETRAAVLAMLALSQAAFATNSFVQWERQRVRYDSSEMRSVIAALVPVAKSLGG
jgi:hypothetical protein